MLKYFVAMALVLFGCYGLYAQQYTPDANIQKAINEQLWKPFKKTYESRDWKGFNDLHTDDVMRVNLWSGIKIGEAYKKSNAESFQRNAEMNKTIDFRFEHRIHNDSMAYEVGYYKLTYESPNTEPRSYYAQFHVRLRKEDGRWKICQDFDVDEINGRKVSSEEFENPILTDLD